MIATLHTSKFNIDSVFAGFNYPRYIAALPRGTMAERLARRTPIKCGKVYLMQPNPVAPGQDNAVAFYLGDGSQPFTRWAWCDDANDRIGHTGWFCDYDGQGDKIRGLVVRLPHDRGFLAGWSMGDDMIGEVYRSIYHCELEAARVADAAAEAVAEEARNDAPDVEALDLAGVDDDE